ncbi:Holliday junction branch migration protein RuvA [Salinivibrio sp. MA607]|uniref:Holliday junction branch migration protein RuvA n=1 Tax=Salinivibrio sp. MA607 TaxID=1909457 RepID=UPI0009893B27|nr:Holliday junction branch migration protein RuvA [Salinivibrio sp. MA607]OOF06336.1 Holliday junction branch migration protein RuvA [Salinivibrio sp. MA607]
MIGRLHGTLIEKQPPEILIDVNGVGYEVSMPMNCLYQLPDVGETATVYTHFVVREDAQLLYGFSGKRERALFREVIKANGVGPKLGLAILSGMTANHFVDSVEHNDVSTLVKIPGVGKKTAERLVIEMRDRLKNWEAFDLFTPRTDAATGEGAATRPAPTTVSTAAYEAVSALVALGYKAAQAEKVVKQIATDDMSSEDVIRHALRSMV